MWRKQEEPKASPPAPEVNAAPKIAPIEPYVAPLHAAPPPSMPMREASTPAGHLTKALKIKGEITGTEDLFIDGEVHGQIRIADAKVTIGSSGRVVASVEAREIVVRGKVKGDLRGRERVQIAATGGVIGDVVAHLVSIDEGAEIRGNVDTTRGEERRPARVTSAVTGASDGRTASLQTRESLPTA